MNQLLAYIINERLMELVEHEGFLTQAQGGFRQDKSTDINACKLYDLTRETQCLKRRFLPVDIDFKSAFNSMSQASLWAILEAYGIPDVDLLKSLYEHVCLPERDMGSVKITFNTGVTQGSVLSLLHKGGPLADSRARRNTDTGARRLPPRQKHGHQCVQTVRSYQGSTVTKK